MSSKCTKHEDVKEEHEAARKEQNEDVIRGRFSEKNYGETVRLRVPGENWARSESRNNLYL